MSKYSKSRRNFLRGALATAGLAVSPIPVLRKATAANAPNNGKFMIVVNMFGGNDGLNMVVPTHRQPYFDRRATIALTSGTHALAGGYELHPSLSTLKAQWDAGDLAVVNKVGYPNQNLSHFTSQNIYSYGVRDYSANGDGRGWLGRFADANCASPVEPLGVISVGTGRRRDFEADTGEALVLNSVTGFNFDSDNNFVNDHDLRRLVARDILDTENAPSGDVALTVFDTSKQAHELVDRVQAGTSTWTDPGVYQNNTLGNRLRVVSQLLEGQQPFNTKVLYTGFGGFDTHSDQTGRHANLMTQLDQGLAALETDLKARNMWDDCIVMVISEFGRRNFENGSFGTDHGHGNAFLFAGGAVKGQQVTGDYSDADLNVNQPGHDYDFREIYANLLENHIGVSATPVFPETYNTTGDIDLVE